CAKMAWGDIDYW
nr:immunoglobulin heavy chain junction region [Macaca mulatta]